MRAVSYIRCSTLGQDLSPEVQREAIATYCRAHGLEVRSYHEDIGVSGATPVDKRPGLMEALQAVRAAGKGACLIVAKHDRLARDVVVAATVEAMLRGLKAQLVSADGNANGDGPADALMRSLLSAFAAYERAMIAVRTKSALAVRKARGLRVSRFAPWGFRFDGDRVVPDEAKQALLARAKAMRAAGQPWREVEAAVGVRETVLWKAIRAERRRLATA